MSNPDISLYKLNNEIQGITGETRVCGLIGHPVEHTLSPLIHNTLARICHKNMVYVPFEVDPGLVDTAVKGAYELNVLGLNVTVPHKIEVMSALVSIDSKAESIGAVNTLVRTEGGYKGYNTDHTGLKRALESDGIDLHNRDVVILGAGGAARSAAFLCAFEESRRVYILNRNYDKAIALCDSVNEYCDREYGHGELCKPLRLSEYDRIPGERLIVIQASSVGLYPDSDNAIIPDCTFYDRIEYGYDVVYKPAVTAFMKYTLAHGGRAANGLKMLLYQGVAAFEMWNDIEVTQDAADAVLDRLKEVSFPNGGDR